MQSHTGSPGFLSQIEMRHGPAGTLGRYLLLADRLLRQNKIRLKMEPIARLAEVNRANRDSWAPLYPGLDVNYSDLNDSNAFCFLGYNSQDEVVVAQGARLYDFSDTNFTSDAEQLKLLYAEPQRFAAIGERCQVNAWAGKLITGRAGYSGATWVRPDHRGNRLVEVLPRLSRTTITALWGPDVIFGIMVDKQIKRGLLRGNGFRNVEWSIELTSPTIGDYRFALLWMKPQDVIDDLDEVLSDQRAAKRVELEATRRAQ